MIPSAIDVYSGVRVGVSEYLEDGYAVDDGFVVYVSPWTWRVLGLGLQVLIREVLRHTRVFDAKFGVGGLWSPAAALRQEGLLGGTK